MSVIVAELRAVTYCGWVVMLAVQSDLHPVSMCRDQRAGVG